MPAVRSSSLVFLLSLLILGTATLAHASDSPATGEPQITLKIANLPTRDRAVTPDAKATLAIADAFRAKHPNVKLVPFEGLVIEGMSSMDSGPLMAMAGGVAPEVLYVNFRQSDTYISQGFLYPLDDYIAKWEKEEPVRESGLIPKQVWDVIKRNVPDGKEHIWAAPYGVVVMALMYRKDLFKKAGIDPDSAPQNWDELYDYALRTSDPEKGVWGLGMVTKTDAAWNFMSLLWSAGSNAVVQDKSGNWMAAYDDEGAVKATKFYWQLRRGLWTFCDVCGNRGKKEPVVFSQNEDTAKCKSCGRIISKADAKAEKKLYEGVVDGDPGASRGWARGKIAMMFNYLQDAAIAQVNPNQIGICPVPKGPDGLRGSEINATMMGINSTIKDPKIRDLAWEYIRFFASLEARRIRTKTFVEAGFAKYVQPKWLQRFGYSAYLNDVPKGWEETLETAIHDSKPEPFGKNCQLIYREMQYPLDEAIAQDNPDIPTILKKNVEATNIKLMGRIPEGLKRTRNTITTIIVCIMAIAFTLLMRMSMGHYSKQIQTGTSGAHTQSVGGAKKRKFIYAWIVMAPALLSIALWQYYPLARGSMMAFQDYKILLGTQWIGINNFSQAFFDVDFWLTMLRTIQYAGLMLVLGFGAPIILALLLHEVPKGKIIYRVIYYLPAVTTGVVIYMLWKQFYDPSPQGMLNQVVGFFHIGPQKWLQDSSHPFGWIGFPAVAMLAVILPQIWASVGPGCIIYLAALQSIPEDIYEAADLDGCGFWGKFWRITIPYLKALIIINFVGAFIGAFRAFEPIFIMTAGGPAKQTTVLGLEIWFNAYVYLKYGFAVSMAWVLGSLLIGFTVLQLRILSNLQFKTASAK
ncbi:MAG: extracellular solute-binding protein [Armatimonadia bacterium]